MRSRCAANELKLLVSIKLERLLHLSVHSRCAASDLKVLGNARQQGCDRQTVRLQVLHRELGGVPYNCSLVACEVGASLSGAWQEASDHAAVLVACI